MSDPGDGAPAPNASPRFGMFGSTSPLANLPWNYRLALAFSAAADAANTTRGAPSDNVGRTLGMLEMQRQMGARSALAQAMLSGDPASLRGAKAQAIASGLDLSHFQPRIVATRYGSVVAIDPITGRVSDLFNAQRPPPQGFAWGPSDASGNPTLVPIEGGPKDPSIAGGLAASIAKARATGRVPIELHAGVPSPTVAAPTPAIAAPPGPWLNYGDEDE